VTKILNSRYLDLISNVCIFAINYSNNREIKTNLAYLHAFILQCFRMIKMVILVALSAIFLASPLSILVWELSKWHGFPKLLSPFQGPNRFAALLPQSDKIFQYHNEYRMLSSFVRTLPVKFHQLYVLARLQKTLRTLAVYTVN